MNEQVRLVGFRADIPSFLHLMDVFAFDSTSEGFGQVLIEAMAAGKAVVATDTAPLNEIVEQGDTGLLVEPHPEAFAAALVELAADSERTARLGERGRQRVLTQFSAERMAAETLSVYTSLNTAMATGTN